MKAAALRLLARRSHTREELRRKLRQRGHPAVRVEPLLDRLAEIGYLNEEAAARSWVRHRLDARPMGRRMLAAELARKGVPPEVREAALGEAFAGEAERDLVLRAARKRMRAAGEGVFSRDRFLRFLLSRGFPHRLCLEAADRLCGDEPGGGALPDEVPLEGDPPSA